MTGYWPRERIREVLRFIRVGWRTLPEHVELHRNLCLQFGTAGRELLPTADELVDRLHALGILTIDIAPWSEAEATATGKPLSGVGVVLCHSCDWPFANPMPAEDTAAEQILASSHFGSDQVLTPYSYPWWSGEFRAPPDSLTTRLVYAKWEGL